jgi:hypothetical protein
VKGNYLFKLDIHLATLPLRSIISLQQSPGSKEKLPRGHIALDSVGLKRFHLKYLKLKVKSMTMNLLFSRFSFHTFSLDLITSSLGLTVIWYNWRTTISETQGKAQLRAE